jgi:hypothetical protein
MIKKTLYSALLVAVLFSLVSCSTIRNTLDISAQPVPKHLTMNQIKKCIQTAGAEKKWHMTEIKPGLIQGTIILRNHSAVIEIPYSEKSYSINYVSSVNLGYKNGKIHRNYNKWITLLNDSIQKQMINMPST